MWGVRVLSVRGIPIVLHWTFLVFVVLFPAYLAYSGQLPLVAGVGAIGLVCMCVALHELSHAVVAQQFGIRVRQILLLPIGGLAAMDRIPEAAAQEALIAVAGPAFNVAASAALFLFMKELPVIMFDPVNVTNNETTFTMGTVLLFQVNVLMAVFNLLPAFPMDGGRLLRAALVGLRVPYPKATRAAVIVGSVMFGGMFLIGVMTSNPSLAAIAVLLFFGGQVEGQQVRIRSSLQHLTAGHLLPQSPVGVDPDTELGELVHLLAAGTQRHFPVIARGRLVGVVCHQDLAAALAREGGHALTVGATMRQPVIVDADESLADVARRLAEAGTPVGCVLAGGRLAGLVSLDQLRGLARELEPGLA